MAIMNKIFYQMTACDILYEFEREPLETLELLGCHAWQIDQVEEAL